MIAAVQTQNNVNPAGQIGAEPMPKGQQFTYTVRTQGRLVKPEEFGEIILRANRVTVPCCGSKGRRGALSWGIRPTVFPAATTRHRQA